MENILLYQNKIKTMKQIKFFILFFLVPFLIITKNFGQKVFNSQSKCIKFSTLSKIPLTIESIENRKVDNYLVFGKNSKNSTNKNNFLIWFKKLEKIKKPLDYDIRAKVRMEVQKQVYTCYLDKSKTLVVINNNCYQLTSSDFDFIKLFLDCNCFP